MLRDVHWFEVTEKLRDSHPAYTGPSHGLQSAESHGTVCRIIWLRGRKIFLFGMNNVFLILPFSIPLWISSPGQGQSLDRHYLEPSEMLHWREERRQEYQARNGTSHRQGTGLSNCSYSSTCWPRQTLHLGTVSWRIFRDHFVLWDFSEIEKDPLASIATVTRMSFQYELTRRSNKWNILMIFLLDKSQSIQTRRYFLL